MERGARSWALFRRCRVLAFLGIDTLLSRWLRKASSIIKVREIDVPQRALL
jgi:hypothetical protein